MLLQIWNFLLKTPFMKMAVTLLFFNKFAIFFKDSESSDTYLHLECPQLVPYYCVLLNNLNPKCGDFLRVEIGHTEIKIDPILSGTSIW